MKLGVNSKMYLNTDGPNAGPSWSEVDKVSDLDVDPQWKEGDASVRDSRVEKSVKTLVGLVITGKIRVSDDDPLYIAFWEAAHSDEVLDLMILNGKKDVNGVRGYRIHCQVHGGKEDQAMPNVLFMEFTLKPTIGEAKKVVIAAGNPVEYELTDEIP